MTIRHGELEMPTDARAELRPLIADFFSEHYGDRYTEPGADELLRIRTCSWVNVAGVKVAAKSTSLNLDSHTGVLVGFPRTDEKSFDPKIEFNLACGTVIDIFTVETNDRWCNSPSALLKLCAVFFFQRRVSGLGVLLLLPFSCVLRYFRYASNLSQHHPRESLPRETHVRNGWFRTSSR